MYWWIPLAAGAALGALKNAEQGKQVDKQNQEIDQQNKVAATRELWSPFTGQHGQTKGKVYNGSLMGDVGSGAIAGLGMWQSMNNANKGAVDSGNGSGATDSTVESNRWGGNPNLNLGVEQQPTDVNGLPVRNRYNLGLSR